LKKKKRKVLTHSPQNSHLLEVVIIISFYILMKAENKRRDKIQSAQEGGLEGRDLDATAFGDLTDRENMNFRYIY
jgi:hypothetical protein